MLNFMRKSANSWLIVLLFGIMIFVFAINFGPWAGGKISLGDSYAAKVNSEVISMAEFRTAYASQIARIKQFRPDYNESQSEMDGLKQMILDQLVSKKLLTELAREHSLRIGPKTLAEQIKTRIFGQKEDFDLEEYKRRVNGYFQTTIPEFEKLVEEEMVASQMADLLGSVVHVSDEEAKREFLDKNTKVAIEYVKIDPKSFSIDKEFSKADIENFAKDNKQKIAEYYEKHITDYVKENQVKASHILVKMSNNPSEQEKKDKKAKAEKLLERVKKGEDFATLAKAESEDPGTKENGGDLGYFASGNMVEQFSKAAFALNPGQVSEIVESPFGFHIIKVFDKKEGEKKNLEQATPEIAKNLLERQERENKAKKVAEEALAQLSKGIALDKIKTTGVKETTSKFSKSSSYIPKIGKAENLVNEAFTLTETEKTPKEVIFANDQYFAIRLKEKENADIAKFNEEKEALKMRLSYPRKRAMVQQYLEYMKKHAKITYNKSLSVNVAENI